MAKATTLRVNFFNQIAQIFKEMQHNLEEVFEIACGETKENRFEIPGDYEAARAKGLKLLSKLPKATDTPKDKRLKAIKKCANMHKAVAECNAISREITDTVKGFERFHNTRIILQAIDEHLHTHMDQYMVENTNPELESKGLVVAKYFWETVAYREFYQGKHRNEA